MKTALIGVLLLLAASGASAQEENTNASETNLSAVQSGSPLQAKSATVSTDGTEGNVAADNASAPSAESSAAPADAPAAPTPTPTPRYLFGERDDYRFQLAVGLEYLRFQSSQFNANMFGVNTSLAYYTNSWFGFEGDAITAFSTETYSGFHAKVFGGAGGIRIGSRRAKWEPWGHALVGGAHVQPQTALGNKTGILAVAGGGVDYRVHARLSFRAEGDWVYTGFFSQTQNSAQVVGSVVLHF